MSIDPGETGPALEHLQEATDRLVRTIAGLGDAELRMPSLLPGWSRAHVATHLARNADSLHNLLTWARTGIVTPQYESLEQRNHDIAEGAVRPAAEIAADVRDSAARLAEAARTLPDDAWHATVRAFTGWEHPAWYTVFRRWREVEVHHADLDAGYGPQDWSEAYVRMELTDTFAALRAHGGLGPVSLIETTDLGLEVRFPSATDTAAAVSVSGPGRAVLTWLTGRSDGSALAVSGPGAPALPEPPVWPQDPVFGPARADA